MVVPDAPATGHDFFRVRNIFAAPLEMAKDFLFPHYTKTDEQKAFLQQALKEHFVFAFAHLEEKEKNALINAMELTSVEKGSTFIKQGDKGDYMYVLQSGTVGFFIDGKDEGEATTGAIVGELALLYDCPRAATVLAKTDCQLWRLEQYTFRRIRAAHVLANDEETRATLRKVPCFKDLPEEYIYELADSLFKRKIKEGEVLAQKGDEGGPLIIVKEGYVLVTDISVGSTKYADLRLGPGDSFGEALLVTGGGYQGTATAATDVTAWFLSKERFLYTLGDLDMNDAILKSLDKKILMASPLFAYSDIDSVEMELMASKIEDVEYSKGSVIATMGDPMAPALYIIRSGAVTLSDKENTQILTRGENFGFGKETLILQQNLTEDGMNAVFAKATRWLGDQGLATNSVTALHDVVVSEDAKLGMLSLASIVSVLYDVSRLGRCGATLNATITTDTLEKCQILGAGSFGQVWLTRHEATNTPYALKIQHKAQLIDSGQANGVINEKNITARMDHPFVMTLVNAHQDDACVYMVMDLLQGGELGSVMHAKDTPYMDEDSAKFYAAGILEGLSYMHRRHFVYRDLKGENVLLDQDGYCVIVDLGFAKYVPDKTWTFCGTPLFIAPEVIMSTGHDKSADVWSFGVLIYEMLTGENPFYEKNIDQMTLFKRIVRGDWSFPENFGLSAEATDLIECMLVTEPKDRLGCLARGDLDLRDHPWFAQTDFCKLYNKEIAAPWVPQVRDPFDSSNFDRCVDLKKKTKDFRALSAEEQQLFKDF